VASEVEISNRALQRLGASAIVSLTDESVNARAANLCYAILRDSELRKHTWNFAIKRAKLAKSTTDPLFTRTNAFPLPADFLRLLPQDPEDNLNSLDWQIENGSIVTFDSDPLEIRYIFIVTDPNAMDVLFREALSAVMAKEMAEQLTQSNSKKQSTDFGYKEAIADAKRVNAIERVALEPPEDEWVTIRLSGRSLIRRP